MIQTLRIIEILVGVGVLIMIHELGHFLAAKWAGVRVDKFALGLGPKIVAFQRGETEYSIRWIPLGGFCAMAGEEPGSETNAPPERQFRNQSPGKRAVILFAGVLMNFLLAIVLFSLAFGIGVKFPRALIGRVQPGSPVEQAGLRPGDEIIGINGDRDVDFQDLKLKTMLGDPGDRLTLTVKRRDTEVTEDVVVTTVRDELQETPVIGIEPACGRTLLEVEKDGAAWEAGLRDGDVILEVDGKTPLAWNDLLLSLSVHIGKPVPVKVKRDGQDVTVELRPRAGHRGSIGITPKAHPAVLRVIAGRPADGQLEAEDRILKVAGHDVHTVRDLLGLTARAVGVATVYTVQRGEQTLDVTLTPTVTEGSLSATIGVVVSSPTEFTVGAVEKASTAEGAQIQPGDVLVSLGGIDLTTGKVSWDRVQAALDGAAREGRKLEVRWKSAGSVWRDTLEVRQVDDPLAVNVGFAVESMMQVLWKYPPWRAPVVGLKKSWQTIKTIYLSLRAIVTARLSPKDAAGPVGIAHLSYKIASQGIGKFLWWLAFLCANLAVVNLLPIPPFDGGLLVVTAVEKLRGRNISDAWLMRLQLAGWAFVIVLIVLITYNDIMRWITLGP